MESFKPIYTTIFRKRLLKYSSLNKRTYNRIMLILKNPYDRTEPLQEELKGLRSARIGRNFRIIFAISKEIKTILSARKSYPEFCNFPDNTIVFITFGPHQKAYRLK